MSIQSKTIDVQCGYYGDKICQLKPHGPEKTIFITKQDELNFRHPQRSSLIEMGEVTALCEPSIFLTEVPTQLFQQLPKVTVFNMQCKNISKISADDFIGATNLRKLSFIANQITQLEVRTFSTVPSLAEITLSNNLIHTIADHAFDGLNQLEIIKLDNNKLKTISKLTFANLPSLFYIALSSNEIELIEEGAFNLPKLSHLQLGSNQLKVLADSLFTQAPELVNLNLEHNQIHHVNNALYVLPKVHRLFLAGNKVEDLDLKRIAKLPSLYDLDLSETDFDLVAFNVSPADISAANSTLHTFYFTDNNKRIGEVIFEKLKIFPNLQTLHLENNSVKKIDLEALRSGGLSKIQIINIDGNNFDTEWLRSKAKELSMFVNDDASQITLNYNVQA